MVVDDDEASRQFSDRLSLLPETETSGSYLGSSGNNQLEDDEMALEQPESESAGSVPGNAAHPPSRVRSFTTTCSHAYNYSLSCPLHIQKRGSIEPEEPPPLNPPLHTV